MGRVGGAKWGMRLIPLLLLGVILPVSGWSRIGDTIDKLRERYGTAERLHDEIGGLTVVEFTKPPYVFKFQLLDLKAEGVEINGIISQEEAEVLIARNVPSQKFSLDLNPHTPYAKEFAFWKVYIFTDDSTAYYYSLKGDVSSGIKILTPKMAAYNEWRKEAEKTQKINDANLMIDSIEKPEGTPAKSRASSTPPSANPDEYDVMDSPPTIFRDRSAVSGGAQMGQEASFASMGTAIGRYQHKLYLSIGSRWNLKVLQSIQKIGNNRVVIRFFVNSDGSISQIHIVEGDPNSILGQISGDAINQSSNLIGPFPSDLLFRYPKGFPWHLAFYIY